MTKAAQREHARWLRKWRKWLSPARAEMERLKAKWWEIDARIRVLEAVMAAEKRGTKNVEAK